MARAFFTPDSSPHSHFPAVPFGCLRYTLQVRAFSVLAFKMSSFNQGNFREGDWTCPCSAHNFASRGQCFKCHAPKGPEADMGSGGGCV
jgi:hypothetical protein